MESLSLGLSSHPPSLNHRKPQTSNARCILSISRYLHNHNTLLNLSINPSSSLKIHSLITNKLHPINKNRISTNSQMRNISRCNFYHIFVETQVYFLAASLVSPLSSLAIEAPPLPIEDNKINLEAIVVSIDDFFNKYPFFVAGVTFIWLVVIPLAEEYFSKFKFISAIDAFQKLRDDQNCQLVDIREKRSLAILNSPNLKFVKKSALQVAFQEGDEDGFLKQLLEIIQDPANTTLCILDNFDGASIKVAELLVNKGFKEAYAIRGGIRGKNGWLDIQESMLPPSVHIRPKKKAKSSEQVGTNGDMNQKSENHDPSTPPRASENSSNGYVNSSTQPNSNAKSDRRSSSPYPNYPDLKPPSSPTPSKP
ncbi:hypothetical protein LIER_00881 [Lithospermum erythrorhizon]|uniref:Rhodanese domain-containing protein n=1 Tax=Lithospermum erythrorhizon TaxID=34254 RepID=A0AAV3NJG1_LITER